MQLQINCFFHNFRTFTHNKRQNKYEHEGRTGVMKGNVRFEYIISLLLLVTGCNDGGSGVAKSEAQENIPEEWLADATDCLNGYLIISDYSGYGIIDTAGHIVSQPIYSELFFLTDDIAAGYESGYWNFINSDGKIVARSEGEDSENADSLLQAYNDALSSQDAVWEDIVERYEDFCSRCATEDVTVDELKVLADSIMLKAHCADGFMSDVQKRRAEQAYSKYRMGGGDNNL